MIITTTPYVNYYIAKVEIPFHCSTFESNAIPNHPANGQQAKKNAYVEFSVQNKTVLFPQCFFDDPNRSLLIGLFDLEIARGGMP